jgi:hypothetical protein
MSNIYVHKNGISDDDDYDYDDNTLHMMLKYKDYTK